MKFLKWLLIILLGLALLGFAGFQYMKYNTKKASPEETVVLDQGGTHIEVFYNRPSKRGREIFGGLVPFNEVWRTGANEATTFSTNVDLRVGDQVLPSGTYTLWTIPGPQEWTVIWNGKMYPWGVSWGEKASREPEHDVLQVQVPVEALPQEVELFTIGLDGGSPLRLTLRWDRTGVDVPMVPANEHS